MSERTTAGPRPTEPGQATQDATVRSFQVSVPDEGLVELRRRLAAARWLSKELVRDQLQGVQLATLQALARYWATDYDLRRIEARLNALPQFTTEIDGVDMTAAEPSAPAGSQSITERELGQCRRAHQTGRPPVELKGRGHALTIGAAGARSPTPPWPSSSASPAHPLAWLSVRDSAAA
jgi:hypothetical protein